MNKILTYGKIPKEAIIVTFHNNIIKVFNEQSENNFDIKISEESGIYSLDYYIENKKINISKGSKTEMDILIKQIAIDLTKKKNNLTIPCICGFFVILLIASIHCFSKPSYHKNITNSDYQNTISSIVKQNRLNSNVTTSLPPQIMDSITKNHETDVMKNNIKENKPNVSSNDLNELLTIQKMIKNNESWDSIFQEVNNVKDPNLAKKIQERLSQIINIDREKNIEAPPENDIKSSYSIEDINGNSNLVSGKVHIPIPGGGVGDFGLK
jgi:hypothetical protein